jgi:pSer/pThr/pTyr-binding forkhead associated (FHA) protein
LNQNGFVEVAVSDRRKVSTYLVYGLGDGRDQVVIWDTRDVEVGRSKNQDIMLSDPEVSREHTLFRKDGELGTLVNGERISSERELQPGDVVRIGPLELKFGNTTQTIRPGENVRFASELKASHLAVGAGAAGRTMLAFKPEDDLALGAPTAPPAAAPVKKRAVSFDGTFEEMDGDDPLGVEDYDAFIAEKVPVRDLDKEFETETRAPDAQAVLPQGLRPTRAPRRRKQPRRRFRSPQPRRAAHAKWCWSSRVRRRRSRPPWRPSRENGSRCRLSSCASRPRTARRSDRFERALRAHHADP